LHGAWDKGNKWTGAFLNAHTNLTEITDAMDLLWRNSISPSKVVLGLAFYGRAFTATSESCMTPGCTFESAAEKGPCSRENGILMNSEIIDIIKEKGLTPTLYEKEAVKVVHWGNQWVAFDDKETLKMKADFARGQCLGGVMVWAISHDITHSLSESGVVSKREVEYHYDYSDPGAFTYAIASATNRTGSVLPIGDGDGGKDGEQYDIKRTDHNTCYWSGCLQGCKDGFALVRRSDDESQHDDEMMYDDTGCDGNGIRKLCCPTSDMPSLCGWYKHGNGDCTQFCPSGMIEIGSNKNYCKKNYQAACCRTGGKSIAVYDTCDWAESPMCDAGDCSHYAYMKNQLFTSSTGSGGAVCNMRWATMQGDYDVQRRKYCCDTDIPGQKWTECERAFSLGSPQGSGFCNSDCPSGKIKVGLDRYSENCRYKSGTEAICCKPVVYTEVKTDNPLLAEDAKAIDAFFDSLDDSDGNSDICKADVIFEHKRRRSLITTRDSGSALATRDSGNIYDRIKFLDLLALAYAGKMSSWRLAAFMNKYNEKVPDSAPYSNFNSTRDYAQEWAAAVPGSRSWDEAADFAACNFYYVEDQIKREESGDSSWISCALPYNPCAEDSGLCSTDDDLPPESCPSGTSGAASLDTSPSSILQKRTITYCYIYVTVNGGTAQGTVTSLDYLSAGQWPAGSVQLTQAITMRDETDCAEGDMRYVVLTIGNTAGYQSTYNSGQIKININ
jgi:chitinase